MHNSGSLDYKVINPAIRNILDIRSELNNTIQIAMPFVKATTTIGGEHVKNQLNGGIGFTLGLHSIDQDVQYEDIYSSQKGTMPLLGYTYVDGKTQRVYATDPEDDIGGQIFAGQIFDKRAGLFTNTPGYVRIPPPGITSVTIGRAKNGLLAQAQLNISIPSLLQLESLHRLFLVPGVGMVLEWGQRFANDGYNQFGETGILNDLSVTKGMFPWYDTNETLRLFKRLAENSVSVQEIIDTYVIRSQGQYMWMFGRVANFNVTSLSDGSFQATVKIVGPSEDSWAYSTKNTVIPTKDPSYKFFCASETNSVYSYFADTAQGGINLKSLLDKTIAGQGGFSQWTGHVTKFTPENKPEKPKDEKKSNVNEVPFLEGDDAYYMSWRFFVNVVLNDPNWGVKRIFASALDSDTLSKIGMLQPYATGPNRQNTNVSVLAPIDDPMESFIGYNKYLRSIDPSTMIIVNEVAAREAAANKQYNISKESKEFLIETEQVGKFSGGAGKNVGNFRFDISAQPYNTDADVKKHDRGFLSTGVWINHRAVVESMLGGDTIVKGITNLLERMNQATLNYWQLTLDVSEPIQNTNQKYNYTVVDANWRENSYNAVSKFIDNVHTFNKYARVDNATGKLVGSELIECNIDLSLPKRLFSQIATLGLVQPGDLEKAGVDVQGSFDAGNPKTPKLSDPNDTLRRLYATLVINPTNPTEQGPDLTILPRTQQTAANGVCGQQNVQTVAQTAGNSAKAGNIPLNYEDKTKEDLESLKSKSEEYLKRPLPGGGTPLCELCEQCRPSTSEQSSNLPVGNEVTYLSSANEVVRVAVILNDEGDTDNTKALFAAGHRNGRLNSTVLKATRTGHLLYKEAADAFDRMATAASIANPPVKLEIVSPYRDLSRQASLIKTRGLVSGPPVMGSEARNGTNGFASTPGTSNHGWGLAIDFSQDSVARQWLLQNSENFGFKFANLSGEPWHWEYVKKFEEPVPPASPEQTTPTPPPTQPAPNKITVRTNEGRGLTSITCEELLNRQAVSDGSGIANSTMTACEVCEKAKAISNQTNKLIDSKKQTEDLVAKVLRDFPMYRSIFRYLEIFPEYMVTQITDASNGSFSNAFGAAPGSLSVSGDLVLPGINGLRVGELFWIDRIPAFYKVFGAFQIMSIEDKIEVGGWKTQINARFNFLGTQWKLAMEKKLKGG